MIEFDRGAQSRLSLFHHRECFSASDSNFHLRKQSVTVAPCSSKTTGVGCITFTATHDIKTVTLGWTTESLLRYCRLSQAGDQAGHAVRPEQEDRKYFGLQKHKNQKEGHALLAPGAHPAKQPPNLVQK